MRMSTILGTALLALCAWAPAQATVLRVIVVETADPVAYMAQVAKVDAKMKALGGKQTVRAWRGRFAGDDAGAIVVTLEYPDMVSFATTDAKTAADAEFQALMKEIGQIRKIVSDSIYEEIK